MMIDALTIMLLTTCGIVGAGCVRSHRGPEFSQLARAPTARWHRGSFTPRFHVWGPMARLAASSSSAESLASSGPWRYFVTILLDNLGSTSEETIARIFLALVRRFHAEQVLVAVLSESDEVLTFKKAHGLVGRPGPLVVVSEENPFASLPPKRRSLIDLSHVRDPDDIRNIMTILAEHAHGEDLLREAERGELQRKQRGAVVPGFTKAPAQIHGGDYKRETDVRLEALESGRSAAASRTLSRWLANENEKRGTLWKVVGVALGLLLALLALIF
jgi:hypothetical protein